jgi:predicted GTPase
MSRWRSLVVVILLLFPLAVYVAVGGWALWQNGLLTWLWLPIPVCWGAAFLLLRWWKKHFAPPETHTESPLHWTPRDQAAWKLVEERSQSLAGVPPDDLTRVQFYVDTAMALSLEIARVYHPKANDPISQLTIPEILAALELAFEDLAGMVDEYVPAGHLLTVNHYRQLSKIPKWSKTLSKFYWPISTVLAPTTVIARYAASRFVVDPVAKDIQANVLAWFTMTFIQRVGYYAIELNSGRLAGGAKKFRETMRKLEAKEKASGGEGEKRRQGEVAGRAGGVSPPVSGNEPKPADAEEPPDSEEPTVVTIALVGQTKAGKSSLENAILGQQEAKTDILPATSQVQRYRLDWEQTNDHLVLLDTVGFATEGATEKQLRETRQALKQSDLVLFVMNANSPAREPDREMLATLADWFEVRKELKPIPVLGVLTHIDLLSPVMEWSPPYDWQSGKRPKEISIREAVEYNRELFEATLAGVVPVCADVDRERVFGVEEFVLPAITTLLDNARACSVLRTLHEEMNQDRAQRVVKQFWNVGKTLVQAGLPSLQQWLTRKKSSS